MIFQFVFPWPVWLNCAQLGMVWKISDPCTNYISKLSVTVKMWWRHKWYNGRGSASVAVAEAPWTLPFDVRVLGWIECKFVLLFWVLYVTSPANLQKFVSRPFINITSEINSLCFSLWLREAHRWWSLKLISQLFLRLRSLLMERVEKSPKPVGRIAKTSLPQTKYFKQIFCSSRKDSTAGNVRLRCLW